ncbi:tetratricopeptide repeat protein [Iodidimonas sp. SYSU 1G8]|uniref:tetratricopeptide repeat protein n=1 Tax=Iodidimonas sp. SYSU 1G8 TaxID=3133967 RepID=UPI0031FEE486
MSSGSLRQAGSLSPDAEAARARLIELGNRFIHSSDFDKATDAFSRAHALRPEAMTAYGLGLVREKTGEPRLAIKYFRQALTLDPTFLPARVNLGNLLREDGALEDALHHHLIAYGLSPLHRLTLYNLGLTQIHRQALRQALHLLRECRTRYPDFALNTTALQEFGSERPPKAAPRTAARNCPDALRAAEDGRTEEALALFETFVAAKPDAAEAWSDYGALLQRVGRTQDAIVAQETALMASPYFAPALNNLGSALCSAGRMKVGAGFLQDAIVYEPGMLRAWTNLAKAYKALGDTERALEALLVATLVPQANAEIFAEFAEQARQSGRTDLAIDAMNRLEQRRPDDYMVFNNRGTYLLDRGDTDAALTNFDRAAALRPDAALPHSNRGAVLELAGRYEEARTAYASAAALSDEIGTLTRLVHVSQHACQWDGIEPMFERLAAGISAGQLRKVQPFSLLAVPGVDAAMMRAAGRAYGDQFGGHTVAAPHAARPAGQRLRIGYVSSDLYGHATAWLLAEVLERHDTARIEVFVYSYGAVPEDETRARLRRASEHFIDIAALSDDAAAERIRADGIDVLIDLKGYTRGGRPGIFARRPAPVQVNYLGFPGTLGTDFMDYIIADAVVIPPSLERFYAETVLRLPHCYQPNDRNRPLPPPARRADVGLPEDAFVFCSFNNAYKLTPDVFDQWCALLADVPGSVLWVLSGNTAANDNLHREAAARGIDPARLVFAGRMDLAGHLARFRCADLFLDTFPCTAHTTASDALWCGVPVVTRLGETFASRVAASILHAAGLPQLVAESADDYLALARRLATAPAELAAIRQHLEQVRMTCPLFDSKTYTRDLEDLYASIAGEPAARRAIL